MIRLHQHAAGKLSAAGAAGDLRQQLEDALGGAEVGQPESGVRAHHADQRDAVDVVALGDHLRADEKIDLACVEPGEQALHLVAPAHGVAVHASDARVGEEFLQPLLALLRARAEIIEVLTPALWAELRD